MAAPHPALDAAARQFSQQPGVTPTQVASLRVALSSAPGLTQQLDAQASSGALHGFVPAVPGSSDRPVGEYDLSTRTVTLPASAFPGSGSSPDLHSVLRVQAMLVDFAGKSYADAAGTMHPVSPDMLNNLQSTLNSSPALAEEIKRAATTTDPLQPQHRILESFAFTAPGAGVGGSFNAPRHAMGDVHEALAMRHQLVATYRSKGDTEAREITIHPLGLIMSGSVQYLVCTLFHYADIRQLAVHRLSSTAVTRDAATSPDDFVFSTYARTAAKYESQGPIRLVARFTPEAAEHLRETRLSTDQQITDMPDIRRVEVTATVEADQTLRWWLKAFGAAWK